MPELSLSVSNVGGIDRFERTFSDPVTIITGSNASNKTSLLQALAFGLGRQTVPIRSGASEARVELEMGDRRVVRTAEKKRTGVTTAGDGLLADAEAVELFDRFACLFEFNDVRQAVREGRPVEELLKEPIDLNALESRRSELLNRKNRLKDDVGQLADVESELESRQRELSATRERIDDLEAELDERRERQLETTGDDEDLDQLHERRASLVHERKRYERQIEELEGAIDRLEGELAEKRSALESAREAAESTDIEALRAERDRIRSDLDDLVDRAEVLQSALTANREMLESTYTGILGRESTLTGDEITCWACGNEATVSEFEETIEELTELIERDKQRQDEDRPRLDELEDRIAAATETERQIGDLEAAVRDREASLETRRESLETKRESLAEIRAELTALDERLAEHESEQSDEMSALQDEIERLQTDLHAARSEADRLDAAVDDLQSKREERSQKQAEIDRLTDEITSLTARIETLEADLREGFNDAINDLIEVLDYKRIERIWLDGEFDLIVAREVDGVVRQDDVSNLSESEREMVGLMLALAGYVAYDVSDVAPVLLMDTLGAFDSERTAKLISYVAAETPFLVAAMLPDSAAAFDAVDVDPEVVTPTTETPPL
jgi:chromosome segregation ATPase